METTSYERILLRKHREYMAREYPMVTIDEVAYVQKIRDHQRSLYESLCAEAPNQHDQIEILVKKNVDHLKAKNKEVTDEVVQKIRDSKTKLVKRRAKQMAQPALP